MSIKQSLVIATPELGSWPFQLLTGDFKEKIRKAAEIGYDGVELVCRDIDLLDLHEIKRILSEFKMQMGALITGAIYGLDGICLMSPDKDIERIAMQRFKRFLEFAGDYGAVVDVGLFRGKLGEMPDPVTAQSQLVDVFYRAAQYAGRCGSRITLEPLNRFESDFIHNAQDGLDWVSRVNHPDFGLMLDTFHMNIEDASIDKSVRESAKCLWHIHIGDSNRLSVGKGHFDFSGMIQTLKDIGYTGFLSAEHLSQSDPDTAARETISHLRQFI